MSCPFGAAACRAAFPGSPPCGGSGVAGAPARMTPEQMSTVAMDLTMDHALDAVPRGGQAGIPQTGVGLAARGLARSEWAPIGILPHPRVQEKRGDSGRSIMSDTSYYVM